MDLDRIYKIGIEAAYKGGEVIQSLFGRLYEIRKKGTVDLVTEADIGSEKVIIETIRCSFPDHDILAEESGLVGQRSDCLWIIDPLDGTTNFAHQLPIFSVSIAFALKGEVMIGIVFNPMNGELFSAKAKQGAELNGRKINVSANATVLDSLLVTGFPYNAKETIDRFITRFKNCLKASQGVRRLGSAALDLCFVACGRFDGFWEENLKPWDTAAGVLIAREAGAVVTDFSNRMFTIDQKEILATNGKIHEEMLSLLEVKER